jgi:uncharacterized protein YcbX
MASASAAPGSIVSLWRYPVKSMQGEELNATPLGEGGLLGDRAFALIDAETGKIASAKNPKKWPHLFDFRARYVTGPNDSVAGKTVRITLPDGTEVLSVHSGLDELLSGVIGRAVHLQAAAPEQPALEEYWPDVDGLPHRDAVTTENMPPGGFFDCAPVHVLTTATLERLRQLYPDGRFEARRFRPNVVVALTGGEKAFAENDWIGRTLLLGDTVRLRITIPCPRCVMTTLAQADLPHDLGILRAAVANNDGHVGVYARVERGGTVRRGDAVRLE